MSKNMVLNVQNLSKEFDMKSFTVKAVNDVSFEVERGKFIGLIGPSGSGKTTLINSVSGLLTPTSGNILLDGNNFTNMKLEDTRKFRLENIGLVFQEHLLIESLTAIENIELPLLFLRIPEDQRREKALKLLKDFNLEDKADHLPEELSGGEQQRIGIARALVTEPSLILADEPTGDLDGENARLIMKLFREIVDTRGTSIIMVSHNPSHRKKFDRVLEMKDGKLIN